MSQFFLAHVQLALLLSVRFAVVVFSAPPFTLLRLPGVVKVSLALGMGASIASSADMASLALLAPLGVLVAIGLELMLGLVTSLALSWAFSSLGIVGRLIDIQAGFGLALVVDPSTRGRIPLTGNLFAYLGAVAFLSLGGLHELVALLASKSGPTTALWMVENQDPTPLVAYLGVMVSLAFGAGAAVVLMLFVCDLILGLASRAMPQMNILMMGFQIKALVYLLMLSLSFAISGIVVLKVLRGTLEFLAS